MPTAFSELCKKQVVNCQDGALLGRVSDLELCVDSCRVTAILVTPVKKGFWQKGEPFVIPWEKIEKIGADVILVSQPFVFGCECNSGGPKRFFLKP